MRRETAPHPAMPNRRRAGRFLRHVVVGLAGLTFLLAPARCARAQTADGLTQAEVGQAQLRASTARVAAQLEAILGEFERNQLRGEEVELLRAIHGVLGQLSEQDMVRVIELLQVARSEDGTRRSNLVEAFSTQKSVGLKLRQILLEYQRQQELSGIAARLEELANRQNANLRETRDLAESASGRRREWLTENQRISLQLQLTEQQSLRDEVASVIQRLESWSAEQDNEAAARAAEALERPEIEALAVALDRTLQDLQTSRLLSAAGRQRATRQLLREVARLLVPPADELEALRAALAEVEQLADRQRAAHGATRQVAERSPELEQIARTQADLVDETDVTRAIVAGLDPAAAEQVAAAVGRMQEARGGLRNEAQPWRTRRIMAATQQDLAVARLQAAARLLRQRIDTMERQQQATSDPLSNLRQVREDINELIEREQELKNEAAAAEDNPAELQPLAPRQGDLGDRASDTASRAALDSPEVADQVSEAVAQMRQSQRALGGGQNDPGAQQAAIDALSKALETLDAQLAQLEAAAAELAEIEDLLGQLIAIIEAQKGLIRETARLARQLEARPPEEVGRGQSELAGATRELEAAIPPSIPDAAMYLRDAGIHMALAGDAISDERAADAREPQDTALAFLIRAREELERRMAELQSMLGLPPDAPSLEDLSRMIKAAQQEVNSAMSVDELRQMAQDLAEAGQHIEPATSGRMGRLPRMIGEPLQRADQALTEGAAAAEGGESGAAQAHAATAQEALAAAAAALDLAMAGMGQQPGAGPGQGGEGNTPGQGQGRGRGRTPGSQSGKGTGDAGNFFGAGGADGPRRSATGSGQFIGLPARERAALLQSQGEKYPQEYAPMIEQYLKNLSDQVEEAP